MRLSHESGDRPKYSLDFVAGRQPVTAALYDGQLDIG
jgi:hypothetical protein